MLVNCASRLACIQTSKNTSQPHDMISHHTLSVDVTQQQQWRDYVTVVVTSSDSSVKVLMSQTTRSLLVSASLQLQRFISSVRQTAFLPSCWNTPSQHCLLPAVHVHPQYKQVYEQHRQTYRRERTHYNTRNVVFSSRRKRGVQRVGVLIVACNVRRHKQPTINDDAVFHFNCEIHLAAKLSIVTDTRVDTVIFTSTPIKYAVHPRCQLNIAVSVSVGFNVSLDT